jgi:maltose-binding protein MalE
MDLIIAPIPPINGKFPAPLCAVKGYTVSKNVMKDNKKKRAVSLFVSHMTGKKVQLALNSIYKQLPSLKAAAADQKVLSDPLISGQKAQLEKSVPMPIIAQMRVIWDAIKPVQQELLSGKITPEEAPALMQKRAEEGLKTLGIDLN